MLKANIFLFQFVFLFHLDYSLENVSLLNFWWEIMLEPLEFGILATTGRYWYYLNNKQRC